MFKSINMQVCRQCRPYPKKYKTWPPGGPIPDVQTVISGNNKFDIVSRASRVSCLKMKRRWHFQSRGEKRKIRGKSEQDTGK